MPEDPRLGGGAFCLWLKPCAVIGHSVSPPPSAFSLLSGSPFSCITLSPVICRVCVYKCPFFLYCEFLWAGGIPRAGTASKGSGSPAVAELSRQEAEGDERGQLACHPPVNRRGCPVRRSASALSCIRVSQRASILSCPLFLFLLPTNFFCLFPFFLPTAFQEPPSTTGRWPLGSEHSFELDCGSVKGYKHLRPCPVCLEVPCKAD